MDDVENRVVSHRRTAILFTRTVALFEETVVQFPRTAVPTAKSVTRLTKTAVRFMQCYSVRKVRCSVGKERCGKVSVAGVREEDDYRLALVFGTLCDFNGSIERSA